MCVTQMKDGYAGFLVNILQGILFMTPPGSQHEYVKQCLSGDLENVAKGDNSAVMNSKITLVLISSKTSHPAEFRFKLK